MLEINCLTSGHLRKIRATTAAVCYMYFILGIGGFSHDTLFALLSIFVKLTGLKYSKPKNRQTARSQNRRHTTVIVFEMAKPTYTKT